MPPPTDTAGPGRRFFDAWARFYDLSWIQRTVYRVPHDAVMGELRRAPCARLLDVGCGTGQLLARVRRELPGIGVLGCDFSRGMLHEARAREPTAWWVQGDAGHLPFRSGSVDAVVSTEAYHWFPDQRRALAEFRRVLRPGGRLLLVLVSPRVPLANRVVHLASRAVGEPFYWPTAAELRRQVTATGLRIVRQRRLFRLPGGLFFPAVLTVATTKG